MNNCGRGQWQNYLLVTIRHRISCHNGHNLEIETMKKLLACGKPVIGHVKLLVLIAVVFIS